MEIFARRLRELREGQKLSRETMAEQVGVVARTIQRYENDEREPSGPVLALLARYFHVSSDYLLGLRDTP